MTGLLRHVLIISGLAFGLVAAAPAQAQATRTWVSGVGDDVNPCSRTAPCKTFAGAISKTASGGEINAIDAGGFGAVTITKAVTIDGGGGFIAGIVVAGTNGITVSAAATDAVKLRNLDINGAGTGLSGISFLSGKSLLVENTKIYGFTQQGISFTPNANAKLDVINSTITDNSNAILVKPSAPATALAKVQIVGSSLEDNVNGLQANDNSIVSAFHSSFSNNTTDGLLTSCASVGCQIFAKSSIIANNVNGVVASGAVASIVLSDTAIFQNTTNLLIQSGGRIVSFGTNENLTGGVAGAPTTTLPRQ